MDGLEKSEDTLDLSTRTWNRVTEAANKAGYREGVEEGKQSVFQEGFDKGYEEAFKTAFALGKYKGLATVLPSDYEHPPEIEAILDKTRRGACHVCIEESRNRGKERDYSNEKSDKETIDDQRKHSAKIIGTLHEYFEPLLKESGIDISESNFQ